jgi:hypothetical protein
MPKTVTFDELYPGGADQLAEEINNLYMKWRSDRRVWEREKLELRNYLFATDTTTTTNATLPWKNKTTVPKLTQLRDNLHANYMAALFPSDDWFDWVAADKDSASKTKAETIKSYMKTKLAQTNFVEEVSKLVLDYIDYGNAFGEVTYEHETHSAADGGVGLVYSGPRLTRISPYQIVFDLTAKNFDAAPKITRSLWTLGDLEKRMKTNPEDVGWVRGAIDRMKEARKAYSMAMDANSQAEVTGFKMDGFGSLSDYYTSGYIEILEFEGDLYDLKEGKLYENHRIVVGDQKIVLYKAPFTSWLGRSNKKHAGWRLRPDNLMAAGPLDNLVGMQYRLDHLENLRADVMDQIAHPVVYERGYVEEWQWGPGEKIHGDTESEVTVLSPDATALAADFQIDRLLALMEELAGAPKQAMGIRTPGEKTAYEVQTLENAAGRIFQNKVTHFEKVFIEPVLNAMLASARQNLDGIETISSVDDQLGATLFTEIKPEDLKANGKLRPQGARHFAAKATMVQNLNNLMSSFAWQDQGIRAHFSGLAIAKAFEELLGVGKFSIVRENVAVAEGLETARISQAAQDTAMAEGMVDSQTAGITEDQLAFVQDQSGGGAPEGAVPVNNEQPV